MTNEEALEVIKNERNDAERDLLKEKTRVEWFDSLNIIPPAFIFQRDKAVELVKYFEDKLSFYDLKIQELNATINQQ